MALQHLQQHAYAATNHWDALPGIHGAHERCITRACKYTQYESLAANASPCSAHCEHQDCGAHLHADTSHLVLNTVARLNADKPHRTVKHTGVS
jgi:hypothetical protein